MIRGVAAVSAWGGVSVVVSVRLIGAGWCKIFGYLRGGPVPSAAGGIGLFCLCVWGRTPVVWLLNTVSDSWVSLFIFPHLCRGIRAFFDVGSWCFCVNLVGNPRRKSLFYFLYL